VIALLASAGYGCAGKAIEVSLLMPTGDAANFDVSCIDTVHVVLHDGSTDFSDLTSQCIPVANATSLEDLQAQIRGKFELSLEDEDLVAIEVRGLTMTIPGECGTGMNIFYGGEEFVGQERIDLRIEGAFDCKQIKADRELKVRPIDFLALASTPAGMPPVCRPADTSDAWLGAIRPTNISLPDFPTALIEVGVFSIVDETTELATLPAWGNALPTSCLAASSFDLFSASCIYPGNATVCAQPGEVEVPMLEDFTILDTIDRDVFVEFPTLVFGVVYDTVTKRPVEGATVALADPARGKIFYADRGAGNRLDPKQVIATTASGLFLAYMKEPSVVNVTQGGSSKAMRLGGVTGWGSAVIVPLR
jgi:hypothetical protein